MTAVQWASLGLGVAIAGLGAVVAAPAGALGLPPVVINWVGIVLIALGPLQAALQSDKVVATLGLQEKPDAPTH